MIQRARLPLGHRAVAGPQAGLKAAAGQPLARNRPAVGREDLGDLAAPPRHRRVDVDQEDQLGPETPRGRGQHGIDLSTGKIAPRLRQDLGGVEVAIGDDDVGALERRAQHFVGQLDLAGHVEQQLGPRGERHVARVPAEVANPLGHLGGERSLLAQMLDRQAALAQHLGDAVRDRRLATAVDPLEDDKHLCLPSRSDEGCDCEHRRRRGGWRRGLRLSDYLAGVAKRRHPHAELGEAVRGLQGLERRPQPERHLAAVFDLQDPRRERARPPPARAAPPGEPASPIGCG